MYRFFEQEFVVDSTAFFRIMRQNAFLGTELLGVKASKNSVR